MVITPASKLQLQYLPGKRDTTVRETVTTDIKILSANGSRTVPNTDFWFAKFLAMNPSS